ncbi:hypothetical protein EBZ80_03470 [bacterium]|nr:hypothetical protein [bacterium]
MRILTALVWLAAVVAGLPRKKYYRYSYMDSVYYQSYHTARPSDYRCMVAAFRPIGDRELLYRLLLFDSSSDDQDAKILLKGSMIVDPSFENRTCFLGLPIHHPGLCLFEVGTDSGSYILFSDATRLSLFGMVKDLSLNDLVRDRLAGAILNETTIHYESRCNYSIPVPFE